MTLRALPNRAYFRAEELGEGAFGSVLLAYDEDGNRFAAKRFETSDEGDLDATTVRELAMLRVVNNDSFSHPNVVQLFDISLSIEEGALAMIMPVYKHNLYSLIENSPGQLKGKTQLQLIWGSLKGLAYLHSAGVMHRDLKSDNIMVTEEMEPVLIDFSVGKFFRDDHLEARFSENKKTKGKKKTAKSTNKAKNTTELGTVTYIAPEIYAQNERYNEKADVYSLGVVAYEILHKKVIQAEKDKAAFKLIAEMVEKLAEGDKKDSPMSKLLLGMLAFEPDNRLSCVQGLELLRSLAQKAGLVSTSSLDLPGFKIPEIPLALLESTSVFKSSQSEARQRIREFADIIEYNSAKTRQTAEMLAAVLEIGVGRVLLDTGEFSEPLKLENFDYLYLVLLAGKLYEPELVDCWEFDVDWDPKLRKFDVEIFTERELIICKHLAWNLYWKKGASEGKNKKK